MTKSRQMHFFFFFIFLFSFICSCTPSQSDIVEPDGFIVPEGVNPKHIFSSGGYFIDSNNDLFYYENTNSKILSNIVQVYGDYYCTFAIDEDGAVWAWGTNDYGSLGLGHSECQEKPQKIEGLRNIISVFSSTQSIDESQTGGSYTFFLSSNGDLYFTGTYFDLDDSYYDLFIRENDVYVFPIILESLSPIEIHYDGVATELFYIGGWGTLGLGMLMQNNDLVSAQLTDRVITTNVLVNNCIELLTLIDFCIAITNDDSYFGWGYVTYTDQNTGKNHGYSIETPSGLAGLDQMITCSSSYISMTDGSFWLRKRQNLFLSGELITDIEDVVCIHEPFVLTAKGTLYSMGFDSEGHKVADTGYKFGFEKSNEEYNLNLEDEFWKYGGYRQ